MRVSTAHDHGSRVFHDSTWVDRSEAEADLRARLAVIDLHAPAGAAPPLAAPTGQPTSAGDRQAKLAAQQQRFNVAGHPDTPIGDAQPPPASAAQAPVPHQPPAMQPAPQPASTGNAYVDTFNAPPSKQAMELWGKAGTQATTQAAADQAKFDAALPPMPINLDGGEVKGGKGAGANFWTHLKDGLVQWLFGTFADAGIHMPASFDIAGIFDLVCQVLGLTWPRLRGKIVKIIGEKNTERLEFVAKYVQALVTGGFSGLWQQIQQDMSGLWDQR